MQKVSLMILRVDAFAKSKFYTPIKKQTLRFIIKHNSVFNPMFLLFIAANAFLPSQEVERLSSLLEPHGEERVTEQSGP